MRTRTLNNTRVGLGDFVRTITYGYLGRITQVHFGCPEDRYWIDDQTVPIREEALTPTSVWFSVLVHGGGSVAVPAYDVEDTDAFTLDNDWAREYWPREYAEVQA